MAESCRIIPHVFNSNGDEVESKLYLGLQKLMSYVGMGERDKVLPLYQKTLDKNFNRDMMANGALFDENNEVSLYDFWKTFDNGAIVSEDILIKYLNEEQNFLHGTTKTVFTDKKEAFEKIISFNDNTEWNRAYIAIITGNGRPGAKSSFTIDIVPKNDSNKDLVNKYKVMYNNSSYMTSSLINAGLSTGAYDHLEAKFTNGYTDFSNINKFFDDLKRVINITKGKKKGSIPSEFGSFLIESMSLSPLVARALNQLQFNDSYYGVLDDPEYWDTFYHGNARSMAIEALGQIITGKVKSDAVNQTLIPRIQKATKIVFNKINEDNIITQTSHNQTLKKVRIDHTATKDLWDKFFDITLRRQNIYSKRKRELGLTEEDASAKESILSEQGELLQKLDIAAHHDWNEDYIERDKKGNIISIKTKDEYRIESAIKLMDVAISDTERIKNIVSELRESIENNTYRGSMNSACARVRAIIDYIESYEQIFTHMDILLNEAFNDPVLNSFPEIDTIRQNLRDQANELNKNLQEIKNEVLPDNHNYDVNSNKEPLAFTVFIKCISDFIPEGVGLSVSTGVNGEVMTLKELLMYSDSDILGITAWLNSMANTSDEIARIYDHIVKRQKDEARQEALNDIRAIRAAGKKLDNAGFSAREHKWMYQHNDDGTLKVDKFGRPQYIRDYDFDSAVTAFQQYNQSLYVKYQNLSKADQEIKIKKDRNAWIDEHFVTRKGETYPKPEYFPSEDFQALSDAQKEFYRTFIDIKRKYDSYLPLNTNDSTTAIIVRKQGLQKFLTLSKDYTLIDAIKDWYGDTFKRKATDEEFGTASTIMNFRGKEVKKIPIYHTNIDINANLNNYSMNCVANLCLYAHTASNYKALAKVTETLELGRDILAQRRTHKKNLFGKPLMEPIRDGHKVIQEYVYLDQESTNFSKRLENFMDMQVYGKLKTGKYSKSASFFSRMIGLFTTAINVFVGLTNILQGIGQINIEMFAGEHFSVGDILKANKFYFQNILQVILETGNMNKGNKLSLFSEDFNIMQDFGESLRDMNKYEKNKLYRLGSVANVYLLNHIGEHYMQHITALAVANRTKIYDSNDKAISLLDAYESIPIDTSDPNLGANLRLKSYSKGNTTSQIYYTEDGKTILSIEELKRRQNVLKSKGKNVDLYSKALIWKDNEITEYEFKGKFARKIAKLNQDMHGIYNEDDRNQLQQKAYGGLFMMYRKHIAPNFMKRYKNEWYDYDLDTKTSGYQAMFFKKLFKTQLDDLDKKKWSMLVWTPKERANFMRNMGQLSNWVLINLAITLMEGLGDDDDDDKLWYAIILVSLYRAKTENAQFEPLAALSRHSIFNEWWRLAEQPIVGFSIVERISNLTELFDPEAWTHTMQGGPYKDKKKSTKIIEQSIPGFNQIRLFQKPPLEYFRKDVGQEWFTKWMFDED